MCHAQLTTQKNAKSEIIKSALIQDILKLRN